jgi:hypothetical protein
MAQVPRPSLLISVSCGQAGERVGREALKPWCDLLQ